MPESSPAILGKKKLPTQDPQKVLVLAELASKAMGALANWAEKAKECVDFMEGRQLKQEVLAHLRRQGRPSGVYNRIAPLVRLVLGYHRNNRTDSRFLPASTGPGDEAVAQALTKLVKEINESGGMQHVEGEMFMDGIMTGRGFLDTRMSFEDNDLGESRTVCVDPFTVYPDPDGEGYDLSQGCAYILTKRRIGLDELEYNYGPEASDFARPFLRGQVPMAPITTMVTAAGEVTPVRSFGSKDSSERSEWWDSIYSYLGYDFVDPYRRDFALLDFQYKITVPARVFIDLETGDREIIPDDWDEERIKKTLFLAEQRNDPVVVDVRPVKKVRWTTMIGDIMIYDAWSYYKDFTIDGYFPYFRRGQTRGMIDDLIDPQKEVNRRRNAELEIISRTANGGWMVKEGSLDKQNDRNLRNFGARPGVVIQWKAEGEKPEQIEAGPSTARHDRVEEKSKEDINQIAGINESALGELDRVQSGRAIEARQRQAVIAIQIYMDNFKRTKEQVAKKQLYIIQRYYTEPRIYRILGEDGKQTELLLNHQTFDPTGGVNLIVNDVTRGKYRVLVDDTPLSASFQNAQFEEALMLLEKMAGILPPPLIADILVDLSTLPRKEEIKQRLQVMMPMLPAPGGAPGGPNPAPGNAPALDQGKAPGGNVVQLKR